VSDIRRRRLARNGLRIFSDNYQYRQPLTRRQSTLIHHDIQPSSHYSPSSSIPHPLALRDQVRLFPSGPAVQTWLEGSSWELKHIKESRRREPSSGRVDATFAHIILADERCIGTAFPMAFPLIQEPIATVFISISTSKLPDSP